LANVWEKVLKFVGFEFEEVEEPRGEYDLALAPQPKKARGGKVVSLQEARPGKITVLRVREFEQVSQVADALKGKRAVILNLEDTSVEEGRRILDFVSGTCYALNCSVQKIAGGIFLLLPANMEISGDDLEEYSPEFGKTRLRN